MNRIPAMFRFAGILLCISQTCFAQAPKPLASQYVTCVLDSKGQAVASRTVRTPTFTSAKARQAYGEVIASHASGGCKNTSTIYIADRGDKFQQAFQQLPQPLPDRTILDGNGIEAIRWSPSGKFLLAEISQWKWGSDAEWEIKYFLITADQQYPKELSVEEAVEKLFPQECLRKVQSKGWIDDQRILIKVVPSTRFNDENGEPIKTPSCVKQPTPFSFDIGTGILHPIMK